MDKVNRIAEIAMNFSERLQENSGKIAAILSLCLLWFMILSAYDGRANAQAASYAAAHIDVMPTWDECDDLTYFGTTDEGQSLGTLSWCETTGDLLNLLGFVGGVGVYGPDAVELAEETGASDTTRYGLFGTVNTSVMAMVYNPPGVDIPQHMARQWVPGTESGSTTIYAQDIEGYTFLQQSGLEVLWEMFRNLAYAGYIAIIIVAGFMIMFRSKIGGQVTVSIMNTIPGVVIGLIMVTFSFAIVGFIIDIGRLITGLLGSMLEVALSTGGVAFDVVSLSGPLSMAQYAFEATSASMTIGPGSSFFLTNMILVMLGPIGAVVGVIYLVIMLVILGICLYAAIRVYITLIMAYIKIVIDLILGPVYILFGSLPGKSSIIVDWLKRLFSTVLVFPVVFFILNIARWIGITSGINTGVSGAIEYMSGGEFVTPVIEISGIFVIAMYFFAASAPALIDQILAVVPGKGSMKAGEDTKKAISKIPLIGGAFG